MFISILKSKLHRVKLTEANLHYNGSITIDPDYMEMVGFIPNEKVHVLNINTSARIETYVIAGEKGKKECCLNGAAARCGEPGDLLIVLSYALVTLEEAKIYKPRVIIFDKDGKL